MPVSINVTRILEEISFQPSFSAVARRNRRRLDSRLGVAARRFGDFSGLRSSDLDIRLLLLFLARDPGQAQKKRALALDSVLLDFTRTV
ncbi:hypothetical protein L3X38_029053 [Prunus dulcis]|uniref:Uncharacterized protein n=1 Tax=Prunus dulcis TaxID=3755 RepID=A0AAD4VTD7_PRUDU|nr:hypothetical protein L3X38_029053 [Prunus dulcis]